MTVVPERVTVPDQLCEMTVLVGNWNVSFHFLTFVVVLLRTTVDLQ